MLTPYQQEVAIKELIDRHYWPESVARQRVQEYAALLAAIQVAKSRIGPPQYQPAAPGMPGPR